MKELLKELIAHNVQLSTDNGELVVDFQGKLPDDLIAKIRENKTSLINYLNRYTRQNEYSEIPKIEESDSYQVSSGQRRLWLLSQLEGDLSAYNIPAVFQFNQPIEIEVFKRAVEATIERHEVLRTLFHEDNEGNLRQRILPAKELNFEINFMDLSKSTDAKREAQQFIDADRDKSFDLSNGPLFRTSLIRTGQSQYILYLNIHHIISDGWSLGVLSKDIMLFYRAFEQNKNPELEALRIQYKDYAAWQSQQLTTDSFLEKRKFWSQSLKGDLPLLNLSGAKSRPLVMTNRGRKLGTYLNSNLTALLKNYSDDRGGSVFMTLLAGWKILMYHYSNQKDIIIGTPIAGRSHANLEDQIGFYVNTLALRSQIDPTESFRAFYDRLRSHTLECYEHQMYPFDELLEDLEVERDISRNPIFDVFLMLLNNAPKGVISLPETDLDMIVDLGVVTTKFDLDISFYETDGCLAFELTFNEDVYSDDVAIGLMSHFKSLLRDLLENDEHKVGEADYLSDEEKHELIHDFNSTDLDYPKDQAIHHLFELQANRTPDRIAVMSENQSFSYGYINSRANTLANYLLSEIGVSPEEIVGVRLGRTVDYIIAILGILKSGAACSPVNPDLPAKRFEKIAHNFKEIIDRNFLDKVEMSHELSDQDPEIDVESSQLAYVLFSSGSTGEQKPCMIEHKGVVNHVFQKVKELNFHETSDIVHASKLHFVGGIWQLWTPLFVGAKVILPSLEEIQDIAALLKLADENDVKLLEVIPSQIANLLAMDSSNALGQLDQLILTGEPLKKAIVDQVFKHNPDLELINTYGITETSDVITTYKMKSDEDWDYRSVGKPIQNVQVFVLNENQTLCPVGVDGEIYVGGDGVARGYLNMEELTSERFISNPLNAGQRLYRTGDIGRWTKGGELLFLGRMDHQVHIRGFRIELGEIEQAVLSHTGIREAVVLARENDQDETQLVVYFTADNKKESGEIRSYLSEYLPYYMIPDYYVQLDELPLTKNGKLDRQSLPAPKVSGTSEEASYHAPENELEEKLEEIWKSVLNKERVGVTDDFFVLGGHSLKAVRLINLYEREFHVRLSLPELFQSKTIRQHCQLLERTKRIETEQIVPLSTEEKKHGDLYGYPVSDAQRRLWILSQFPEGSVAYNSTGKLFLMEKVDEVLLQKALKATIERHEILRTSFKQNEQGELRQWIESPKNQEIEIAYTDFSQQQDRIARMEKFLEEDARVPFDLETSKLVRVGLIKLDEEEYVFYYSMHHIVSDGWSMEVLSNDVFSMYNRWKEKPELTGDVSHLPALKIQYKDYAAWQLKLAESEEAESDKSYWLNQLGGELPLIDLPSDKQRPKVKTFNGRTLGGFVGEETTSKLKKYTSSSEGTMFMGLLAAWNVLVHRYTGETDIIVGSPIAGREQLELENQIGCYINTLAIRNQLDGDQSFSEVFDSVKEHTLNAFAHQSYSFDRLVEELKLKTDRSRSAIFDISMTYHNQGESSKQHSIESERISNITDLGSAPSKNDVEFHFEEVGNLLAFNVKFNTDVYEDKMIVRLMRHFQLILDRLLTDPDKKIASVDFLSDSEKTCLLEEFNQTSTDLPLDKTLVDLFHEQATTNRDSIALTFGEKRLTYQELDEYSSQLAVSLADNFEIKAGKIVGIQLERSDEMVMAILAVLKAGAAYLPIDPAYPSSRKEYMMQDSGAKLLITHTSFMYDVDFFDGDIYAVDVEFEASLDDETMLPFKPKDEDTAYVIYTSGSSGKPKGVIIPHKAIVNTIVSQVRSFKVDATTKGLQFASFSFDASVWETFIILLGGGTLKIISDAERKDPSLVADFIQKEEINWMTLPPSFVNRMDVASLKGVEQLITAGESAVTEVAAAFSRNGTYYNAYGPTETSICATVFEVDAQSLPNYKTLPIGKPIANTKVHILSNSGMLQPIGVVGEICVSGRGLATGYLNEKELTEEKFISNPFEEGTRLYKTGDLGKWTEDGNIVFVGRKDDQVKVNGHRVEPDEITNAIVKLPEILDAVVIPYNVGESELDSQIKLVAYFTAKSEQRSAQLQQLLSREFPEYMIPSYFVQLDELPLTINGKVDKKQLPNPLDELTLTETEYISPKNEMEQQLVQLWGRTLGLDAENIGTGHRFFELGGDSIAALRLIGLIRKELGISLSVADIYNYDTVAVLSRFIEDNQVEIVQNQTELQSRENEIRDEFDSLKEEIIKHDSFNEENVVDVYPMSDIEKGMVFGYLMNEGSGTYHDQIVFQRQLNNYDHERLVKALHLMIEKHDILRTSYNLNDYDQELHVVNKQLDFEVGFEDLSTRTKDDQENRINAFLEAERMIPFDLSNGPLWRLNVFQVSEENYMLIFQCLHSIIDGWSDASFMTELNNIYHHLGEDEHFQPVRLKATYKDFVVQSELSRRDESIEAFWKKELKSYERLDIFAADEHLERCRVNRGSNYLKELEDLAKRTNTSVKVISLAAYLYVLKILNYDSEIVTGLVTNARPTTEDGDKILGCFLNTIPLRTELDGNISRENYLTELGGKLVQLKSFERLSLLAISEICEEKSIDANPFFDVLFNYVDFHVYNQAIVDEDENEEKVESPSIAGHGRTNTFFDFIVSTTGGQFSLDLSLTRRLKSGLSLDAIAEMYFRVLEFFVTNPSAKLSEINYLSQSEINELQKGSTESVAYPHEENIISLFESQVDATPTQTAVVFPSDEGDKQMSYAELDGLSNQLASYLKSNFAIEANDLIGIKLERSEWIPVVILGILKSGGAYVPIDPSSPDQRVAFIEEDTGCKLLLDQKELESFIAMKSTFSTERHSTAIKPSDLAYIIYTSGTTGTPKGVKIDHHNVVRLFKTEPSLFAFTSNDVWTMFHSYAFDFSVWEMYGALLFGGKLLVVPQVIAQDTSAYLQLMEKQGVTILNQTPSAFYGLSKKAVESNASLQVRTVIFGGEALSPGRLSDWNEQYPDCELINMYGITEGTVHTTFKRIDKESIAQNMSNIGTAIPTVKCLVLDQHMNLVPVGVGGELYIGGEGVAQGYLNRAELTHQRFVENPYDRHERLYRTGDKVRLLPTGDLEYLGRIDNQVKIRGYRIELGEIEHALQQHTSITETVVVARPNEEGTNELVAYMVSTKEETVADLRSFLSQQLPDYMLPSYYVQLEELPLNNNGKVDKKALPQHEITTIATGVEYLAPRNDIEEKLVSIWEKVLKKEKIGVKEDFFNLGGNSIKAMKIIGAIQDEFNHTMEIRKIFADPTIETIALDIENAVWMRENQEGTEKKKIII